MKTTIGKLKKLIRETYNPEKRTWRGKSYKAGGRPIKDLRDKASSVSDDDSRRNDPLFKEYSDWVDQKGHITTSASSVLRDFIKEMGLGKDDYRHLARLMGFTESVIRESFGEDDTYEAEMAAMAKRWEDEENRPEVKPYLDAIRNAQDPKELAKAKRALLKADDAGNPTIMTGVWMKIYNKRKQELGDIKADNHALGNQAQGSADARMDRLLRMRDSSGKATPRKF